MYTNKDEVQEASEELTHSLQGMHSPSPTTHTHTHTLNYLSHAQIPKSTFRIGFVKPDMVCFEICPTDDTQQVKTVSLSESGPVLPTAPAFPQPTGMWTIPGVRVCMLCIQLSIHVCYYTCCLHTVGSNKTSPAIVGVRHNYPLYACSYMYIHILYRWPLLISYLLPRNPPIHNSSTHNSLRHTFQHNTS